MTIVSSPAWRRAAVAGATLAMSLGALAAATPAQAHTVMPDSAPALSAVTGIIPGAPGSCSPGQPKLDYAFENGISGVQWSEICGQGLWNWNKQFDLLALREPSATFYRVWLYQGANGTGRSVCLDSNDPVIPPGFNPPGSLRLTDNPSPC